MANEPIARMKEANVGMTVNNVNPRSPAAIVKTEHSPAIQKVLDGCTEAFKEIAKLQLANGFGRKLNIKEGTNSSSDLSRDQMVLAANGATANKYLGVG